MKKNLRAFSLIEISIVIVIISLIMGMIIRSNSSSYEAKIRTSASLTSNSAVNNIDGLLLWLEPTMTESFLDAEEKDGSAVSSWFDINPTTNAKSNATQSTAGSKPLYQLNGIGGLPSLKFDGVDDKVVVNSSFLRSTTDSFQIFLVAKATAAHQIDSEVAGGADGVSGQKFILGPTPGTTGCVSGGEAGGGISMGTNGISFYEHTGCYLPPLAIYSGTVSDPAIISIKYENKIPSIYLNGGLVRTGLQSPKDRVFVGAEIGGYPYGSFQGLVSEVIVYASSLSDDDRKEVEKYLSQKYSLKLN